MIGARKKIHELELGVISHGTTVIKLFMSVYILVTVYNILFLQ